MKKRLLITGLIIVVIAAIGLKLASNKKKLDAQKKPVVSNNLAIPVNVITTQYQNVDNPLVSTGTLIPFKEADIMAVSAGKLTAVNFELGSHVAQGAIVAQVDNRSLQLSLEAAQLAKSKSDKDFSRYKALLEGEATTEVNFQDAQLNAQNAANQIEQIQKQMADNRIKSPVSGQIVSKLKEAGEYVNPGTVLGHVVDINRLKVNVMISENDAYTLKIGAPVKVTTDIYPGTAFEGKVTFISAQGDAAHNYQVEIALDNRKDHSLRAGTFAYVNFNRKSSEGLLLIPRSALVESMKDPKVYVVKNGNAAIRQITVGGEMGNQIEVLKGLNAGEQIIVSGLVNIRDGSKVKGISQQ